MGIDEMYNSGISATNIAKHLGTSKYKVLKQLKELGVSVYNKQNEIKWDINESINLYKNGKSLSQIAKIYGVSVSVVSIRFKKLNIPVINYQNLLKFDNTIFDKIDSEEKAYWLGFIYADGYVSKSSNNFELSLGLKDKEHLQKFANFLKHINNIKTDSYRCRFQVYDKHLKKILNNLGVTPLKSLTLKFPNNNQVPDNLINHFIRGYFDGDGCIITKETSTKKLNIIILGTKDFLNVLSNKVGVKRTIYKKDKIHHIAFAIENSKIFCDYIYKDAFIFLNRKYNLYYNYLKTINNE